MGRWEEQHWVCVVTSHFIALERQKFSISNISSQDSVSLIGSCLVHHSVCMVVGSAVELELDRETQSQVCTHPASQHRWYERHCGRHWRNLPRSVRLQNRAAFFFNLSYTPLRIWWKVSEQKIRLQGLHQLPMGISLRTITPLSEAWISGYTVTAKW